MSQRGSGLEISSTGECDVKEKVELITECMTEIVGIGDSIFMYANTMHEVKACEVGIIIMVSAMMR